MAAKPYLRANKPGTAKRCELVRNEANDTDTLFVYGIIGEDFWGDGISSQEFVKAITASSAKRLEVRINSPGGDVFEGVAMANALRQFDGEVVAYVDGLAASAATLLTSAAKETLMAKGSMLMIHNAWTLAVGDSQAMLDQAALLEKIDGQIAQGYADRTGVSLETARAWMNAETWFTENEAVEAKLANGLQDDAPAKAKNLARQWNLAESPFQHVPAALAQRHEDIDVAAIEAAKRIEQESIDAATAAHERAQRIARTLT